MRRPIHRCSSVRDLRILSFATLCVLAALLLLPGCSDSDGGGSARAQPAVTPAAGWIDVYENRDCLPIGCPGRGGMHFNTSGEILLGPAEGPVTLAGQITGDELAGLTDAANRVAVQNLNTVLLCEYWDAPEDEVFSVLRLTLEDGSRFLVYQRDPASRSLCYRGERELVEALYGVTNPLVLKYGLLAAG
jgi:hypothetical protein